jgi:hypothetical protein
MVLHTHESLEDQGHAAKALPERVLTLMKAYGDVDTAKA